MPHRPRLMLAALLIAVLGGLAGCSDANSAEGAQWRRYNDIMQQRNCC
jgi:hypothetical protein